MHHRLICLIIELVKLSTYSYLHNIMAAAWRIRIILKSQGRQVSSTGCSCNSAMSKFYLFCFLPLVLFLQLALSSDKISSLHTPLLSLSLDVRENGALRPVTVEMNKEELNTLISSLEAANKVHTHTTLTKILTCSNVNNFNLFTFLRSEHFWFSVADPSKQRILKQPSAKLAYYCSIPIQIHSGQFYHHFCLFNRDNYLAFHIVQILLLHIVYYTHTSWQFLKVFTLNM